MKKQFRLIGGMFFLVVLMLGVVSAADNTSIMYGQNDSGAIVPLKVDSTGRLKMNLNLLNITTGSIASSGNLSIGSRIVFALGGIIDNIVQDWIRITGNLNVTSGNLSLGGKVLRNNDGTLYFGDDPVDTNISILYAQNSSGGIDNVAMSDSGALKLSIKGVKSGVWEVVNGVAQLVNAAAVNITGNLNVSGNLVVNGTGISISSDVQKDSDYTLISTDKNRLVILNSSAGGHTNFTLPSSNNGEIYRILNDADYVLTIKPSGTETIWNSGNGYGIDLPDKGTYVELRYSSARGKWDILQKTGGKVLIEGLVLMEPMEGLSRYAVSSGNYATINDRTKKHNTYLTGGLQVHTDPGLAKFPPNFMEFNGATGSGSITDSTDWDIFGTNTGHKTVAVWVYSDAAGQTDSFVSHYEDANNYWEFGTTTNNLRLNYNTGGVIDDVTGGTLSATTWTHVALVNDGGNIGLYINGSQVAYLASGDYSNDTFAGSLYVGQRGSGAAYLDGRMQDLHISYNNPYNANPNSGSTDTFTLPAAPFVGVMQIGLSLIGGVRL